MRLRPAHFVVQLVATASLVAACSGGSGLAGGGSKAESAKKSEASGSGSGSSPISAKPGEDEVSVADEPAMVSGAFLTCGPARDAAEAFGCVFRKKDGAKLPESPSEPVALVSLTDGRTVKPPMKAASSVSPWHYHFKIEPADLPLVSAMELRAKVGGKAFKRKTTRMDEAPDAPLDAPREPSAPKPASKAAEFVDPAMMFVTSKKFAPGTAEFSSRAAADKQCAEAAKTAGLTSTSGWIAFLFNAESEPRVYDLSLGAVNVDGEILATNEVTFWSGPKLMAAILTEYSEKLEPSSALTWTGFSDAKLDPTKASDEVVVDATCGDWTSSEPTSSAMVGNATLPQIHWLGDALSDCAAKLHLFCITP